MNNTLSISIESDPIGFFAKAKKTPLFTATKAGVNKASQQQLTNLRKK